MELNIFFILFRASTILCVRGHGSELKFYNRSVQFRSVNYMSLCFFGFSMSITERGCTSNDSIHQYYA
jgi:hypothetical protein